MEESALTLRCAFCLRTRSEVTKMFTGPLDSNICNRCIGTLQEELAKAAIPQQPGTYCVACGFETRDEPNISMLKGVVCLQCAAKIAAKVENGV
jgi:hypothetical protein